MRARVISLFLPRCYVETAISAAFLAWVHGTLVGMTTSVVYAAFVFFGTWSIYNLLRVVSLFRRVQGAVNWRQVPDLYFVPLHLVLAAVSGITAIVMLFFQEFIMSQMLFLGFLLFLTLSYRFRWFKIRGVKLALIDLPHAKSLLVAGIWTIICVWIPTGYDQLHWPVVLAFFLYFFGLSIPFDIRDMRQDAWSRRTIPQVFGASRARVMSLVLILIAHVILVFLIPCSLPVFGLSAFVHAYLISLTTNSKSRPFVYRFLDASPILLALGLML